MNDQQVWRSPRRPSCASDSSHRTGSGRLLRGPARANPSRGPSRDHLGNVFRGLGALRRSTRSCHPDGYDAPVTDLLRLERSGPNDAVARVTLARPEVHNAFNASLIAELRQTFTALAREGPTDLR